VNGGPLVNRVDAVKGVNLMNRNPTKRVNPVNRAPLVNRANPAKANRPNVTNGIDPAKANRPNLVNRVSPANLPSLSSSGTRARAGMWCASGRMAPFG
jgi:hypothetical protein